MKIGTLILPGALVVPFVFFPIYPGSGMPPWTSSSEIVSIFIVSVGFYVVMLFWGFAGGGTIVSESPRRSGRSAGHHLLRICIYFLCNTNSWSGHRDLEIGRIFIVSVCF